MKKISLFDITNIYEKEIRKNVKNKKKLISFEKNKMSNLKEVQDVIESNKKYVCKYKIFLVFEPKIRVVMSLPIKDKLLNHVVTRSILMPKLEHFLDKRNVATRKGLGTSYGRKLLKKYMVELKSEEFFILKLDISKYFYSISHEVLKKLLKDKLDKEEYTLICSILDSTNEEYINEKITYLERKCSIPLPHYKKGYGLPIGNLSSQFLSIFYLYPLDHKIIHDYRIKHYVRYMDDFILLHENKEYLKKVQACIKEELKNKYELKLNDKKTKLVSSKEGVVFLGYHYKIRKNRVVVSLPSTVKLRIRRKIKRNYLNFYSGNLNIKSLFSSRECFLHSYKIGKKYINKKIGYYESL